jgi:CBS domain-containing protein
MVSPVVTVKPSTTVRDVATLFLERQISAVPVVDEQGQLVGIVSEGDLMHRAEIVTERRRSWWLLLLAQDQALAADYIKAHARKVEDVMTRNVVTATPDTPLNGREDTREARDQAGPDRQGRAAGRHRQQSEPGSGGCHERQQARDSPVGYDNPEQAVGASQRATLGPHRTLERNGQRWCR